MERTRMNFQPEMKRTLGKGREREYQWNEDRPRQVYELALLGCSDKEMARVMGISIRLLATWKSTKPYFLEKLEDGKDKADGKVAKSLFVRATGYNAPDIHVSNYKGDITITPITKHYPPDVHAQIFWLKNRQRDKWTEPNRTEVNSNININHSGVDLSKFTTQELQIMKKMGLQKLITGPGQN